MRKTVLVAMIISMLSIILTGVSGAQQAERATAAAVSPTVPTEQLYQQFLDPGPAYRGKPFWSWNGELTQDELFRQIQVMKDMGFGGFFMHSRTGLATEYLGAEWFALTNACADEAARLGMEAWLYDEDRWPSGTAGGLVTKNPKFRLKFMSLRTKPAVQFIWSDDIVAAFSCDLKGLNFTDGRRIQRETPAAQYAGKTILVFTIEEMAKSSFYNGTTYADMMNREATDEYIRLTHEKYKALCGERFGKSILGIFTDEPHRGAVMCGFGIANENGNWMTPWTYCVPEEFRRRFGYDIIDRLPELFLQKDGRPISQVKWHYMELCQQLFLENWAKPIYEWCQANNLILTGHALHEDTLTAQTTMQGSLMRFYECMQYPGVDVLTEGNRSFWIAKQLASAARQLGQKWLLSELYGCTGWQFNFESHKAVGDWQALFGINLRCPHLSWYTMEGQAKRDYPASIFYQSGWWRDYEFVETYFARLGLILSQGEPVCDMLVINPVESLWCQIHAEWTRNIATPKDAAVQKLEKAHGDLFHWLAGAQVDFDYGDEEMISRLYGLKRDKAGRALLRIGQADYRVVVLGQMATIRSSTLKILEEFVEAGGKVIFAGAAPPHVDAVASAAAQNLARRVVQTDFAQEAVVSACKQHIDSAVDVFAGATGEPIRDIFCQLRHDGSRSTLAVLNVNRERGFDDVSIRIPIQGYVTEWDCATGKRFNIPAKPIAGGVEIRTALPPAGERVYLVTPEKDTAIAPKPVYQSQSTRVCPGPYDYDLNEDNVCVLDWAKFRIDDGPWREATEVLKIDQAVRDHFGLAHRGGEMVQPWFREKHLPAPEVKGTVHMAFPFRIEVMPHSPVTLCMERPEHFSIKLNGHALSSTQVDGWWVDPAIKQIRVPSQALRTGDNVLELALRFSEDKNIEALYLTGDFGVRLRDTSKSLVSLPEKLKVGTVTEQGLPFYSGTITYRIPVRQEADAEQRMFVEVPNFEAACVKVRSKGHKARMIAWQPYQADVTEDVRANDSLLLDVVLTRRNTFGPLHLVPLRPGAYGPGHWTTGGQQWSDQYMLYPAGLLEAPKLSICTVR